MVGAGDAGCVESVCAEVERNPGNSSVPKKIFLNIVLDLKINNERGMAD